MKAKKRLEDSGKIARTTTKKSKNSSKKNQSRSDEMQELFQSDITERKQKSMGGTGKKKSKSSFKSKSRYGLI